MRSIALVLLLSGCASQLQALSAYQDAAAVSLRAAEDANIRTWLFNACATPISAAVRHPEIVPGLKALCLPAGTENSPALLLEGRK